MSGIPLTRYRLTLTSDGQGGFDAVPGAAHVCYGKLSMHKAKILCEVDRCEDILIDDWLVVPDELSNTPAYYRVNEITQMGRSIKRTLGLERMAKPIWPVAHTFLTVNGEQIFVAGEALYV